MNELHATKEGIVTIQEVPRPETITQLCSFLGSVNFYCRFISHASTVIVSIIKKRNGVELETPECQDSFVYTYSEDFGHTASFDT